MSNCGGENSNGHFDYISDRVERITEALYRVSDLFSDEEPVKWLLRNDAVSIFKKLSALNDDPVAFRTKNINDASGAIGRIIHSLELASSGAMISHVNFEVLKREYGALKEFIFQNQDVLLPQPKLDSEGALPIPQIASPYRPLSVKKAVEAPENTSLAIVAPLINTIAEKIEPMQAESEISAAHVEHEIISDKIGHRSEKEKEIVDPLAIASPLVVQNIPRKKSAPPVSLLSDRENEARIERQKKILDFVKKNGWVGVGDVSVVFAKSISEKTIQRELAAMADAGILRKAGDKRWRRYACI